MRGGVDMVAGLVSLFYCELIYLLKKTTYIYIYSKCIPYVKERGK